MRHCTQCGAEQPGDARFCPRCGTAVVATAPQGDAMLGKVVAERYLLVEKIGQGGSGTIYRGEHTTLRKKVAIKILHLQLSQDETAIERFRREATTVGEIDNDHILQVLDFGRTDDKRLFFAMEYLEGETLTKVIERERQLAVPRVIDILIQVGEALMEAHGIGFIHRDLRPRNIFLTTRRGRADFVKLLDFGLAKLILPDQQAKQTAMGMTFGDPRYMSPEQARGETVDRRADIYSLGVIAYEMLTGNPPYAGSGTFEVLQKHLDAPVPSVRGERKDCPEWLDQAVARALAKKPDDRFITILKLLESLRAEKAPALADAAEKEAHAQLSANAQIKAVGDAFGAPAATSPKETQLLGTIAPRKPAPKVEQKVEAKAEPQKAEPQKVEPPKVEPAKVEVEAEPPKAEPKPEAKVEPPKVEPPKVEVKAEPPRKPNDNGQKDKKDKRKEKREGNVAQSKSGEMKSQPPTNGAGPAVEAKVIVGSAATAATLETPVVESAVPTPLSDNEPTVPVTKLPQPLPLPPPPTTEAKQKDPTGEWFEVDGQAPRAQAAPYDELDEELPTKNRAPMIIGGVAGGLCVVGFAVIMLLPKPAHKPLRGEAPEGAAVASAPEAAKPAEQPKPTVTQLPVEPAKPAEVAKPVEQPKPAEIAKPVEQPKPAEIAKPIEQPKPVEAAKPVEKPKPAEIAKPVEAPKPVEKPKMAEVAKPKAEPKPVEKPKPVEAAKPARPEKPIKVAAADPKKRSDTPPGFHDPFAPDAVKPQAESAQADFFIKLGRQKLSSSDLVGAAANFNKAREYDARSSEAFAGLGEVSFEQGDYNGAAVNLKQALKLSPNRTRYLILLGQAYYKLGRAKDAVTEYKKALRVDPNNQEAQHSLEVAERKLAAGG